MVSSRVRLDGGKSVTPLGSEVIEGWDGYNDNASRSFLFGYAIPFTHTGMRMIVRGQKVSLLVPLANGWDNVKDNNTGKTAAGQLTLAPSSTMAFIITAIAGPEQPANNRNLRSVYDFLSCEEAPKPPGPRTAGWSSASSIPRSATGADRFWRFARPRPRVPHAPGGRDVT